MTMALKSHLTIATSGWPTRAALRLEAVRTVNGFVAPRLERDARLAVATGARGHEHFAAWRGAIAAGGVAGRTERIGALRFAGRAARGAATRRIVKPTTCVELLLTTCENEGRIAIAARERLVCVLHADSQRKEVVEVNRYSNQLRRRGVGWSSRSPQRTDRKALFPATRQYTCPRQVPGMDRVVGRSF